MKRFLSYNANHIVRAKSFRKTMTRAEKRIWFEYLQPLQKRTWIRILRQRAIDQFIVDFYIPSYKLVIEIDGDSHFDEQGRAYDRERNLILEWLWLNVIRFTNLEVQNNLKWVAQDIESSLI